MATTMTREELRAFYDKLAELTEHGTEEDVRSYIDHHYLRLPEEVRSDMLFETLLGALKDEAREETALVQVQKQGLAAIDELMRAKAEIEKSGLTE